MSHPLPLTAADDAAAESLLDQLFPPEAEPDLLAQLIAEAKATVPSKGKPGSPPPAVTDLHLWREAAYVFVLREEQCTACGTIWPAAEGVFVERLPRTRTASESRHLVRVPVKGLLTHLPRRREVHKVELEICPRCAHTRGF